MRQLYQCTNANNYCLQDMPELEDVDDEELLADVEQAEPERKSFAGINLIEEVHHHHSLPC